jgi:hypothetical protein
MQLLGFDEWDDFFQFSFVFPATICNARNMPKSAERKKHRRSSILSISLPLLQGSGLDNRVFFDKNVE